MLDTVSFLVLMISCSLIGCALNSITLAVYVKWRRVYSPKQTILRLLTIIDLFICSIIAPCTIVEQFVEELPGQVRLFLSYMKLSFLFLSNLMHLIVAAQRFAAVHLPTRVQTDCHTYTTVIIAGCFSFAVTAPVVFLRPSCKIRTRGFTVPDSVLLAVFLCGIILMMSLYFNIFNTLKRRAKNRQIISMESRRPSWQFKSQHISVMADDKECKKMSLRSKAVLDTSTFTPNEKNLKSHSICLPVTTKSHFSLGRKVAPLRLPSPMNLEVPTLTPVEIFQRSSPTDLKSPMHHPGSGRKSTEEVANRKIALLMCVSAVVCTVTWIPVWIALPGFVDSVTLKHFFFFNQVINPVLYSLSNKRFLTHLKTLVAFKK